MHYYEKQESKVNLSIALAANGWKIYGFHEDQSDSYTDYFHPASWDGVAVKNGFVLVVDCYNGGTIGGDVIRESYDPKIAKRIQKLQALASDKAASEGERKNALKMIEKFDNELVKTIIEKSDMEPVTYQKNPGNSKWHIEKDGVIVAKGTGVYGFADVNLLRVERVMYRDYNIAKIYNDAFFNMSSEEAWKEQYSYIIEKQQKQSKLLDKFFKLIDKWNKIAQIKIGDGEEERLVRTTVVKKKVYYIAQISNTPTNYVAVGDGWRRAVGLEKGLIYKLSDDKKSVRKLTVKWVNIDGKMIKTYKPEPNKATRPKIFIGDEEAYKKGYFKYISLVEKAELVEEEKFVKVRRRGGEK